MILGTTNKEQQAAVIKQVATDLIDIEKNIPAGGSLITSYEKDRHEHVGVLTNTNKPIRVDPQGEFRPSVVNVQTQGTYKQYSTVPYTEEVSNQSFPCGTYEVTAGNKYGVNAGAGGIDVRTTGNAKYVAAGRTTFSSQEEVNITSNGNINIRGSTDIRIWGNTLNLKTPDQVVIDCNLGVAKNAIINGSAIVDGELFVNHITCPSEIQYTGAGIGSFAQLMPNLLIGYADASKLVEAIKSAGGTWTHPTTDVPVWSLPTSGPKVLAGNVTSAQSPEYAIFVYPHEHPFYNIPFTNKTGNQAMRDVAASLNSGGLGISSKIKNGYRKPS